MRKKEDNLSALFSAPGGTVRIPPGMPSETTALIPQENLDGLQSFRVPMSRGVYCLQGKVSGGN